MVSFMSTDAAHRACADDVEVDHAAPRGRDFSGFGRGRHPRGGLVQISDPVIPAPVVGQCSAGAEVTFRLIDADVARGSVLFQMVGE